MSPTGRRRFRKLNRRVRQRGPAEVRERARNTNGGKARKMILVQWWGRDPLPLPPKPFTPRSLVGMTQGARKRAIRRVLRSEMPSCYRIPGAFYRIGQKLRPCAGCALCQLCAYCGKPSTCIGLYEPSHESQKPKSACDECCAHGCEDGHCELRANDEKRCDGSGVLPARKEQP